MGPLFGLAISGPGGPETLVRSRARSLELRSSRASEQSPKLPGLNGFGPGAIRQRVETDVGHTYRLRFLLTGDPNGSVKHSTMQVRWAGETIATLAVDVSRGQVWRRITIDLVATEPETSLAFRGLTETDAGPWDGVSLRKITESEARSGAD